MDDSPARLKGVGPLTTARLAESGVVRVRDLLAWLPSGYDDLRTIVPGPALAGIPAGQRVLARGKVTRVRPFFRKLLDVHLEDAGAVFRARWFHPHPGLAKSFVKGAWVALAGRLHHPADGAVDLLQPAVVTEALGEATGLGVVPRYPPLGELSRQRTRALILAALAIADSCPEAIADPLPSETRDRLGLPGLGEAWRAVHRPPATLADEELRRLLDGRSAGHRRLCFDQALRGQLLALRVRRSLARLPGVACPAPSGAVEALLARALPFVPTDGQWAAIRALGADLAGAAPMSRLLVGDVGSGKTVVAFAAMAQAALTGGQSLFMAPTTLLAEQHFRTLSAWSRPVGLSVGLLHAGRGRGERSQVLAELAAGRLSILVGTQALLHEAIAPRRFALAIVDEQHRFGVRQRLALRRLDPRKNEWQSAWDGGMVPHLLVMSATPIPRSMALALHGDLDWLTLLDQPPGRRPITTHLARGEQAGEAALDRLRAVALAGGQGFVVCPAIDEDDVRGGTSARRLFQSLRQRLAPATVGMVHGQLPKDEVERTVAAFAAGTIRVLLATTILEVGVDVPGARIMLVMDADRFGLAQLHQLRGRVGRGAAASECHLLTRATDAVALERLSFLASTADGFAVAEADLRQRGAGDVFGERQSGESPLLGGDLAAFGQVVSDARDVAHALAARDPMLFDPHHPIGRALGHAMATMASSEDAG